METETLSKLYLELANIVPAGCLSHREIELRAEVEASHSREMALRACLLKNTPELVAEVERLTAVLGSIADGHSDDPQYDALKALGRKG